MPTYFDQAAATWDEKPIRKELMRAVVDAIVHQVHLTPQMKVLDYGCGTGFGSILLSELVGTIDAADSSEGMLEVLRRKLDQTGLKTIHAIRLDLEHDALPEGRYDLIVAVMVLHHVADNEGLLRKFHALLHPGGILCIADLDTEPRLFHDEEAAATVHHFGFDREELKALLARVGFTDLRDVTAHTIRKPVAGGEEREFPVFMVIGRR
jgi:ubiquinone/menaquinone biosynthesis C-methylase UbiE